MRLSLTRGAALAAVLIAATSLSAAPDDESIHFNVNAGTTPFPHYWEKVFGSGRAALVLRAAYHRDLRTVKAIADFEYVRFHAIFHDDVGLYDEDAKGAPVYNFTYVDQIYDTLIENHVRPFVELSFMPKKLSASDRVHAFWYRPYPNPPKDYAKWDALITAFVKHLIARYTLDEVAQWYFEVWNEPNIDFWTGDPKEQTYYELYDHTARALKAVNAGLRVGGPATAQAAWVDRFIDHCVRGNVPVDFVSTHVYGNDKPEDVFGTTDPVSRRDMVAKAVRKVYDQVKKSAKPDLPIHWTEYNASYMNESNVTDSEFMGPWLASNILQCDGLTTTMSYWTFSDVFEEQGVPKTPFYGGYGLIASGGIPKAAYNAFALLHMLGTQRIQVKSDSAIVTKLPDGRIAVALWNYADPGKDDAPAKNITLHIDGLQIKANVKIYRVDRDHASARTMWQNLGNPAFPNPEQLTQIENASHLAAPDTSTTGGEIKLSIPPYGLVLVEVRP